MRTRTGMTGLVWALLVTAATVTSRTHAAAPTSGPGWEVAPRLWGDPVTVGSGRMVTTDRATAPFTRLEIRIPCAVQVAVVDSAGKGGGVSVTVDDNLQERIESYVRGDTLVVAAVPGSRSSHAGLITVTTAQLKTLAAYGPGRCQVGGIAGDALTVDQYGAGAVSVAGTVDSLTVRSYGSGRIDADKLFCNKAIVAIFGCGDVSVKPLRRLEAAVYGAGQVFCRSEPPERFLQDRGSGQVSFP